MVEEGEGSLPDRWRPPGSIEREGGNVLVVGLVPEEVHAQFCRHAVVGDGDGHRRLLVLTGRAARGMNAHVPGDVRQEPDYFRVIVQEGTAGVQGPDDLAVPRESGTQVGTGLGPLGANVSSVLDEFDTVAGGLDPGEARICFDSVGVLVEEYSREEVFRFLHLLTERVGRAGGIAYYSLPTGRTAPAASMFEPIFDAVVELRVSEGSPQHRWEVDGEDTGWLSITESPGD